MTDKPQLPQTGGTFIIGADGKAVRQGGTAGPLDPAHTHNPPPPPKPARKAKTP